jgi:carbonic anhydrase
MPADDAVKLLKEGNARYVAGQSAHPRQGADRRAETVKGGQHPIATIIGCSDSREPLEVLFDQGVGDLFVVRVAGNVAGPDELATVEYGVGHLGTPVVLVLGHTQCGAVTAAVQNAKVHGNLPFLINQIKPAVARAKTWSPMASGDDLLNKSIKANVWLTMENLLRKSHELKDKVKKGQLLVMGGIYDLSTGSITWLGQHPDQAKLLVEHAPVHAKPKAKAPEAGHAPDSGGAMVPEANAHAEPKKAPAHQ